MSYSNLAPFHHFNAALDDAAHQTARKICEACTDADKEQSYPSALAQFSGELFLRTRGFRIKPAKQIGCVEVEGYGWIQFIPCSALAESIVLSSSNKEKIKAYVAVEVDAGFGSLEELEEAVLLGFNRNFQAEVQLDQLEDLEVFPEFLNSFIAAPKSSTVGQEIGIWLTEMFQKGWSSLDSLSNLISQQQGTTVGAMNSGTVIAANNIRKSINLQDVKQDIELCVSLATESDSRFNVLIQLVAVQPTTQKMFWSKNIFLPEGLEIALKLYAENLGTPIRTGKKQQEIFLLSGLSVHRGSQIEISIKSANSEAIECIPLPP
jgi:hypothetical protein